MSYNGIEVLWTAKYDYYVGWGFKKHQHDYYQIIYVTSGTGNFVLQDCDFRLERDMYLFIKPFEFHELKKMEKSDLKVLEIKFKVHDRALSHSLKTLFGAYRTEDSYIKSLLEKIREEGKTKRPYYKTMIVNHLSTILHTILRDVQADSETVRDKPDNLAADMEGLARIVADYIEKHYMEDVKLEKVSCSLGYNKNYLCQAFKEGSGYTVSDYLYFVRAKKARELITYSDYDLKQISDKVGFQNVHHFSRVFKRVYGIPPGQYRKTELEDLGKDIIIDEKFVNPRLIDTT